MPNNKDELNSVLKQLKTEEDQEKKDTKKCPFCAEEINAIAIKCKHCGSDLENEFNDGKKVKVSNHSNYGMFSLIAFLIPIVGIILGIVYLGKSSKIDRKLGEHTLVMSILFMILYSMMLFLLPTLTTML